VGAGFGYGFFLPAESLSPGAAKLAHESAVRSIRMDRNIFTKNTLLGEGREKIDDVRLSTVGKADFTIVASDKYDETGFPARKLVFSTIGFLRSILV